MLNVFRTAARRRGCLAVVARRERGRVAGGTVPLLQQPGAFAQELFPFGVSSLKPAQQ